MRPVLVILLAATGVAEAEENVQLGLRLPPGFEVTEFADSKLANDVFSMTIDPRGRVIVSGRGYVRILMDDDADGRADRAIDFAVGPADGAQGMLWEGTSLFVTGDGGLRRYRDEDGDDRADGPSELIRKMKTGGEHDAHDIKRGPDGWLYVLCGNMTGIDQSFAQLPTSPIHNPVAGCVIRFSPDLKSSEIVAEGFRNAYRMDWNADGELFTYDSDNERCVSLPWYEPTRFYHVISGGNYGWLAPQRAQWFRLPPYFPDVVAPVTYLGRGSPTGVACYRHMQFPEPYRGGMFAADWTFGRVWFAPLERSGATYSATPETFLEAVGENGFAPTDLAVHPNSGDLFISIGGRGTRGAVYRIRYIGAKAKEPLRGDLPKLGPPPRSLDWEPESAAHLLRQARSDNALLRLQALGLILRHKQRFGDDVLGQVVRENWDHADRYVRRATAELLRTLPATELRRIGDEADLAFAAVTFGLAAYEILPTEVTRNAVELAQNGDLEVSLAGMRLLQLASGDLTASDVVGTIWEGYTLRKPRRDFSPSTIKELRAAFPSVSQRLELEIARTLALVEDDEPSTYARIARQLRDFSDPVDDVHYLSVLARIRSKPTGDTTAIVARALLDLDRKSTERGLNRDRHWPLRVAELHAELARKDPNLNDRMLTDAEFGRPDHVLFAQCPGFDRRRAAEIFLNRSTRNNDFAWNPALVELLSSLPEIDSLPVLRTLWDNLGLREAIILQLARNPKLEDRDKFLDALNSPQLATVGACLDALKRLPAASDRREVLTLVRTMRRLQGGKEEDRLRDRVGNILQELTGHNIAVSDAEGWTAWLVRTHPELTARLSGPDGVDVAAWNSRLERLDWSAGDADRGRAVFAQTGCVACHSGARAVGPDLRGVAIRFSRADLFTAILQPSKDVSPRYQTTLVATADGKLYQGTIIYEAVDSLILQTGADTTVRITNNQIVERRATPNSLMPAGLLDKLNDQEIASIYVYLKTLR